MNTYTFKGKTIGSDKTGHLLLRKNFEISDFKTAEIFISAACRYKLYLNGLPVAVNHKTENGCCLIDITDFLMPGENTLAAHVYTANTAEGLLLDLVCDGLWSLSTDGSFLCTVHQGFTQTNIETMCENYDSRSNEVEFEYPDFDDSGWKAATLLTDGITLPILTRKNLDPKPIKPTVKKQGEKLILELGQKLCGYIYMEASGKSGDKITVNYSDEAQELWTLSGGYDTLERFFTHTVESVTITLPNGVTLDTESIAFLSF